MRTTVRRVALMLLLTSLPAESGASIDYCAMFTRKQIETALGKPVKAGHAPPLTSDACQWDAVDGKGVVHITAYFAGIWNDLSGRSSQRSVPGVGEKAYIGPAAEGGVQAGAVSGEAFYIVHLNPAPNDHQVIDLLRAVVARSHGK